MHRYNFTVWMSVLLNSLGGLIVAMVVKYADNVIKGFATSTSVVLTSLVSELVLPTTGREFPRHSTCNICYDSWPCLARFVFMIIRQFCELVGSVESSLLLAVSPVLQPQPHVLDVEVIQLADGRAHVGFIER